MSAPRPLRASPWFLGTMLLAILVWTIDLAVLKAGVPHPLDDSWEDGIVARQLLQGHGFRTHMIFPALWELRDPRTLALPVLVHGPLVPLLLVPPLALFGEGLLDRVAWLAASFAVLTLIPLFRLTARRFGEPVAAGATMLFTLSPLTIAAVDHYLTVLVGAFLLTWALDLIVRDRPRPASAGLIAGLCYLARPEMLLAAPLLAVLAGTGAARARAGWIFLGAFALAASWWWWARWRWTGSPFFNLSSYLLVCYSPAHPGDALVRDFAATPSRFVALLAESLPRLWHKWAHLLPRAVKRLGSTPNVATGWLALAFAIAIVRERALGPAGATPIAGRRSETLRVACWVALAAIPGILITLLAPVRLYPVPFAPLYAIAAAIGAERLLARFSIRSPGSRVTLAVLALLTIPWAALELRYQWSDARPTERWLAIDRAGLEAARRSPGNTDLMFSDTPDFVAWSTGRPTVAMTREEFERIFRQTAAARPAGLPTAPRPEDTWFHRGNLNDPRMQAGYRLE